MRALAHLAHRVLGVVSRVRPALYVNSPENAGAAPANLADGSVVAPRVNASTVRGELTYPDPSALAQDPAAVERMWLPSAELVGLP